MYVYLDRYRYRCRYCPLIIGVCVRVFEQSQTSIFAAVSAVLHVGNLSIGQVSTAYTCKALLPMCVGSLLIVDLYWGFFLFWQDGNGDATLAQDRHLQVRCLDLTVSTRESQSAREQEESKSPWRAHGVRREA